MMRFVFLMPLAALIVALLPAEPSAATTQKWYEKAVKSVSASCDPAEAKPGQTVTVKITVELNEGYYTYPTAQAEKAAEAMVNTIQFPDPGTVIFVGSIIDPEKPSTRPEPDLGIKELRYCPGTVTYSRKAVVSPKATSGASVLKLPGIKLSVCDKTNCYQPKLVPVEATLKVLDGPAVEVEKAFKEEVAKALTPK